MVLIKRNKELLTTEEEIALNNTISKYKQAIDPTSNSSLNNFGNFLLNELSCHKFKKIAQKREIQSINFFVYIATKAAYDNGAIFVDELKKYLLSNMEFTKNYFERKNIKIDFFQPEATYLLWLDFSKFNLSHNEIKNKLLIGAKLALNDGVSFGSNGNKYFRLNLALSQKALEIALNQLSEEFV